MSKIPIPSSTSRALPTTPGVDRGSRDQSHHSNTPSMSSLSFPSSDPRKKQSKRDEAIRKKIESELSRKRTISTNQTLQRKQRSKRSAPKGTVAALKPSPALTVPENITVAEASQLCAAKRTDCVLVVDDEEGLSGIFTAKDLAYRVTAEALDPHTTPVHEIMTRNPMVTRDTTSSTEALELMVSRHFRHLPVCNDEGNVVGLLDITKVFHEALEKVERSSAASEQLLAAMAGVQSEIGSVAANPQAAAMLAWVEKLREKTALPDLTTVMDSRTQPATVGPKTTVRDAAKLMKERHTTAICVVEATGGQNPRVVGIFTSKDIVLRVIAAGLDSTRCSVVRVMTPHPDTAPPTLSVHDALKKMHNGHYLNLPVMEEDGRLIAIVDVLALTYATLEQMNAVSAEHIPLEDNEGGPLWGRFFDSIGGEDSESLMSGSQLPPEIRSMHTQSISQAQSPRSELHPNDSASVVDDETSAVSGNLYNRRGAAAPAPIEVPADDGTYVFKFRTPSGRTHRFQSRNDDVEHLREVVMGKLASDPFFTEYDAKDGAVRPDPSDFQLSYTDADGDSVLVTSDHDVQEAVKNSRAQQLDRVVLVVLGGKGWEDATAKTEARVAEVAAAARKEMETAAVPPPPPVALPAPSVKAPVVPLSQDDVFGIPRDLLLPTSIGALAVVIAGVFTISRLAAPSY